MRGEIYEHILTQEEAKEHEGLPFDLNRIKTIIANAANNQENSYVITLVKNIIYFLEERNPKFTAADLPASTTHLAKSVEQLKQAGFKEKDENQYAATQFHCGDMVAYSKLLHEKNLTFKIALLNPANGESVGGGLAAHF